MENETASISSLLPTAGRFGMPQFALLNVEHIDLDTTWNWSDVSSPFARVFYVTAGEADLIIGDRIVPLCPGYAYVIPPHAVHSYRCPQAVSIYYLHVYEYSDAGNAVFDRYEFPDRVEVDFEESCRLLDNLCRRYPGLRLSNPDPGTYDNQPGLKQTIDRFNNADETDRLFMVGTVMMLLSLLVEKATLRAWTRDPRLAAIPPYVAENIARNMPVEELAEVACMAPSHFSRMFKRAFGVTPQQYVQERKVAAAQIMLLTTPISVRDLAWRLGFCDSSHFIRVFHRIAGVTPLVYRNRPPNGA